MPLIDLLWACPGCGETHRWRPKRADVSCGACGNAYRRGRGGGIEEVDADGRSTQHDAWHLVDRLPVISPNGAGVAPGGLRARVRIARAAGFDVIRYQGRFLGRFEKRGRWQKGELVLTGGALQFEPGGALQFGPAAASAGVIWPLERLTAIQASSRTLQVKPHGESVVSVRFADASCRYWEQAISAALRALYRRRGWGEIREFQPRIVAMERCE